MPRDAGERSDVQVLDRAAQILGALAEPRGVRSVPAIAARTGLSKSTVRRILRSLEQNGFCRRHDEHTYELGLRLFELGMLVQSRMDVRRQSRPYLEALAAEIQASAYLCVRADDRAVCIDRVDGGPVVSAALPIGGFRPLHIGGVARALLAWESSSEIRRYLASVPLFEKMTPRTITDPEEQVRYLQLCRVRGYVVSDEDATPGIAAIAAPILDYRDAVVAGISVSGLRSSIMGPSNESVIRAVVSVAHRISRQLGRATTD